MRSPIATFVLAGWLGSAMAQTPAFDPREWKGLQAGPPTRVLTIGTIHLSEVPALARPGMMSALLDKLAAYRPEIITIEAVSGEQCEHLRTYSGLYPGSYEAWCASAETAQKAVGMDGPAAAAEVEKTLAAWPADPGPAARRRLAALFLATGDGASAVVQWLRLPTVERHAGDGVDAETLKRIEHLIAAQNEDYAIAAPLAARLGLERVFPVDDHSSDGSVPDEGQPYADAMAAAWKAAPSPAIAVEKKLETGLKMPADLLALYRFINRPDIQRRNIKADMGAALAQRTPQLFGRQYVGAWEVRNLRMVANVRATFAAHPGARVLNIVGATHKAYYDAYLNMMHDVQLVDAEMVLK